MKLLIQYAINLSLCDSIWWNGGIDPCVLTSTVDGGEWSDSRPGRFTPEEGTPVLTVQESGWDPKPLWTLWRRAPMLGIHGSVVHSPHTSLPWCLLKHRLTVSGPSTNLNVV
jgi:hypothetical protein